MKLIPVIISGKDREDVKHLFTFFFYNTEVFNSAKIIREKPLHNCNTVLNTILQTSTLNVKPQF